MKKLIRQLTVHYQFVGMAMHSILVALFLPYIFYV